MRLPILAAGLASAGLAAADIPWQQAGAAFGRAPGLAGMVGQGYATDASANLGSGFLVHPSFVNTPPFLVAPLEDASHASAFPAQTIRLSKFFADLDGDSLTFSVTTLGSGLDLLLSGDTLRLAGQTGYSGSTTVVVEAADPAGSVTDTFIVKQTPATSIASRPDRRRPSAPQRTDIFLRRVLATPASSSETGALALRDAPDDLQVDLLLDGPSRVSVAIFDRLGVPVVALQTSLSTADLRAWQVGTDGRHRVPVSWNRRSGEGDPVATGVYLWKIEIVGADGTRTETVRRLGVSPRR